MIFLDISHNMLLGSIPKEIGSMFYLYVLNLGHNNISGPIPPEIGDLHTVNNLDLSNNELEGGIPETNGPQISTEEPVVVHKSRARAYTLSHKKLRSPRDHPDL